MRFSIRGLNKIFTDHADIDNGKRDKHMTRNAFMKVVNDIVGQTVWNNSTIKPKILSIVEVMEYTSEFFDTPLPMIAGKRRDDYLVEMRQFATLYLRKKKYYFRAIAEEMGGKHHKSIMHYKKVGDNFLEIDFHFAKKYLEYEFFLNSKKPKEL